MNWFLIPLQNYPISFQIALSGTNYQMTVKWNDSPDAGWQFDLENSDTNTPLLFGAPFVCGTDLLSGLEYLGVNGSLVVYTDGNEAAVPTYTNLGIDSNLYFVTT
jgi:hypothetical protein